MLSLKGHNVTDTNNNNRIYCQHSGYRARIRTWTNGSKVRCATITQPGTGVYAGNYCTMPFRSRQVGEGRDFAAPLPKARAWGMQSPIPFKYAVLAARVAEVASPETMPKTHPYHTGASLWRWCRCDDNLLAGPKRVSRFRAHTIHF